MNVKHRGLSISKKPFPDLIKLVVNNSQVVCDFKNQKKKKYEHSPKKNQNR